MRTYKQYRGKETTGRGGATSRIMCQLCGVFVSRISNHVLRIHKTTITDLEAEGKWKNERFPEE